MSDRTFVPFSAGSGVGQRRAVACLMALHDALDCPGFASTPTCHNADGLKGFGLELHAYHAAVSTSQEHHSQRLKEVKSIDCQ